MSSRKEPSKRYEVTKVRGSVRCHEASKTLQNHEVTRPSMLRVPRNRLPAAGKQVVEARPIPPLHPPASTSTMVRCHGHINQALRSACIPNFEAVELGVPLCSGIGNSSLCFCH